MAKCLICGSDMPNKNHSGKIRKYCSNECYQKTRKLRTFGTAICAYCGKEFKETRDRPNIYCSKSCSSLAQFEDQKVQKERESAHYMMLSIIYDEKKKELEAVAYRMNHEKYCLECGKFFVADSSSRQCCSDKCQRRRTNRRKEKRIYRNGDPDLSITLPKLFVRDEGRCRICGRQLSFNEDPNGKYYPSIDHIIPLSKGGKHEWNNVQLLCRKCNTIKCDSIPPGMN